MTTTKEEIDLKEIELKVSKGEKLTVDEYDKIHYARTKALIYLVLRWFGMIGVGLFGTMFIILLVQLGCAPADKYEIIFGNVMDGGNHMVSNIFANAGWDWSPYVFTRITFFFCAILVFVGVAVLVYFSIVDLINFIHKKHEDKKAAAAMTSADAPIVAVAAPAHVESKPAAQTQPKKDIFHHGAGRPKGSPNKPKEEEKSAAPAPTEKPEESKPSEAKPATKDAYTPVQLDALLKYPTHTSEILLMSDEELTKVIEDSKTNPAVVESEFSKVKSENRTTKKV